MVELEGFVFGFVVGGLDDGDGAPRMCGWMYQCALVGFHVNQGQHNSHTHTHTHTSVPVGEQPREEAGDQAGKGGIEAPDAEADEDEAARHLCILEDGVSLCCVC